MTPGIVQASLSVDSNPGMFPTCTGEVDPGAQGAGIAGEQGVGTPVASPVSTLQMTKGGILVTGAWSWMVAASLFPIRKSFWLVTISLDEVLPHEHFRVAPKTTAIGMVPRLLSPWGRLPAYPPFF